METAKQYTKIELLHLINKKRDEHENKKLEINQSSIEIEEFEFIINEKIDKNKVLLEELKSLELEYVDLMSKFTIDK